MMRTETKAGGWVTITHALGPFRRRRTVAVRDRSRQHAWHWIVGRLALGQGFPRGPLILSYSGRRVSGEVRLRERAGVLGGGR